MNDQQPADMPREDDSPRIARPPKSRLTTLLYVFAALMTAAAIIAPLVITETNRNDTPSPFVAYVVTVPTAYPGMTIPASSVAAQTLIVVSDLGDIGAPDLAALMQGTSRTATGYEVAFTSLSERVLAVTTVGATQTVANDRMTANLARLSAVMNGLR